MPVLYRPCLFFSSLFLYLFRGCVCAWVYMWGYTVVAAAASNKRSTESHRPVENTTFPSRSLVKSRVIVFGFSPPLCHTRKKSRPDSVQRMAHTGSFGFALFSSSLFPDLCGSYFFVCLFCEERCYFSFRPFEAILGSFLRLLFFWLGRNQGECIFYLQFRESVF